MHRSSVVIPVPFGDKRYRQTEFIPHEIQIPLYGFDRNLKLFSKRGAIRPGFRGKRFVNHMNPRQRAAGLTGCAGMPP